MAMNGEHDKQFDERKPAPPCRRSSRRVKRRDGSIACRTSARSGGLCINTTIWTSRGVYATAAGEIASSTTEYRRTPTLLLLRRLLGSFQVLDLEHLQELLGVAFRVLEFVVNVGGVFGNRHVVDIRLFTRLFARFAIFCDLGVVLLDGFKQCGGLFDLSKL